jgi:energy-coupling factor transporter transmembrane protein EcfT
MIMLSLGSLTTGFPGLLLATIVVVAALLAGQVDIAAVPKELKLFPFFLLFIFIARSLATGGEQIFIFYGIGPTWEGILLGLQVCWRLILVVLISLGVITSSTSSEIKAAVEFYFAKVPFIPEKRVSTMLSLLIRFIPIILLQVQETMDAQKSRCVELRKNPVYRLVKLTIPVMRRIFQNGDQLAIAMVSRCYTEERTSPTLTASHLDWKSLTILTLVVGLMQVI